MRKPRWILAAVTLSLWTLYAIAMAAQSHYIQAVVGRPITWGRAFRVEFVDSCLWAILTPLILWAAERFPVDHRGWYQSAPVHLAVCLGISTVQKLTYAILSPPENPQWRIHDLASFIRLLLATLDYSILLYAIVLLIYYAVKYYALSGGP